MDACDVLIVGGGPAGSSCARRLREAGLDVVVLDKAVFPREKVCAGWITPDVLDLARIDAAAYRDGRTLEPIDQFRVGTIGRRGLVTISYPRPVSFGILRSEFDEYLLRQSGARVESGEAVHTIGRDGSRWIVNDRFTAPMLVGAGGHFCPVAQTIKRPRRHGVVAAQEIEFPLDVAEGPAPRLDAPELYFCPDLRGYGWCFRKGLHLNVGLGRMGGEGLPDAVKRFAAFLQATGRLSIDASSSRWRGHAYALAGDDFERASGDGLLLAGDAAALASPLSGEGIRPAILSGLMAADTIVSAEGRYTRERLAPYPLALQRRFGRTRSDRLFNRVVSPALAARISLRLLDKPWFVRHVVLGKWFLRTA